MTQPLRDVVIVASKRTPFCKNATALRDLSNMDMLSHALRALREDGLEGKPVDEVIAGAVTHHSRDWNLAREAMLSAGFGAQTPAVTLQQACGTSLQAVFILASKIACGAIDAGVAAGVDSASDPPIVFSRRFSQRLFELSRARGWKARLKALKGMGVRELAPQPPSPKEPRTGLSMGEHCERMARQWQIGRTDQDVWALNSHRRALAAWQSGYYDDLVSPCELVIRDNLIRSDKELGNLGDLRTAFGKDEAATLTAGNSTALTDGASAVLLATPQWAERHGLPVLAYLRGYRSAAVDFVAGEGLLMAPTVAVAELLQNLEMNLQDFASYEIHEAFAAQILATLKAWQDVDYCRERLGLQEVLGEIEADKINRYGGSLAIGHPFAATGARLVGTLAKDLAERGGHGLISVCTAGGMGLAAVLEGV